MVRFIALTAILLTLAVPVFSQSNTVTVDAKSNIYAAGRGVAFNGVVPPAVRFAAGAGKVVTFPAVSGMIACNGIAYEQLHGPDGTVNRCGGTGTNIASWAGISGIVHKTREMFLVGVFLDEREPADPAPTTLDFSTSENYASLAPLIGQVFFIGDGRTSSGGVQQVTAPAAATRLYLGFADAVGFSGAPYAYNDNNGSLQVTVAGVTPFVPGPVATGTTMTVNGKSSIYWSGLDVNWPTEMPPGWRFEAAPGRVMTVRASGSVTCKTGISAPPEGTAACGPKTDIEPWGAVSGIKHPSRSMFLVGVFLNDLKPRGWPPTALDFANDGFTTLAPLIGQTFYIGTGAGKQFVVPHDATRVFLGYARSDQMIGTAGWYQQGGGSLTASIDLTAGADTGVSPVQVDAKSNLYASGRETAFDGYLPPMVRLTPGPGKVLTVPKVTGQVRCCGGGYTTADGAGYYTNLNAYKGLSGIEAKWRGYFLAGVFLDDNVPDGTPPAKLVFTEPFDFPSLEPKIGQVFLIGDGVTTKGAPHEFAIPAAATRLYLGFAMGRLFAGDPGSYWEASDSYTATLSIGGGTTPPPVCTYALSETARPAPAAASTGTVAVTTAAGCGWTAVSGASWITVTSGATGSGAGTVGYSVAANPGAARTGALTIAGQTFTVNQAAGTSSCTYAISPATQAVAASGGTVTVQVTAGTGCAWTASSSAAWLTVSAGASGTGNGTVTLTAAANGGAARSGTATVAGQTLTVNQAAGTTGSTVEITDVVNDADLTPAFAPGGTVIILGQNFAAATRRVDTGVPWPNQLDGVSVEVTDSGRTLAAAVGGIGTGVVVAQLPFGISSTVDLRVVTPAGRSAARTIPVAARSPRLYSSDASGSGPALAFHADNTEVTASAPARPGEEILLMGTGFGAVSPAAQAGQLGINPERGAEPNRVNDAVEVDIQGITVRPRLAILDYVWVGAYIVVFTVPNQVTSQSPSLLVRVGGAASQRDVTLPAQPGASCAYSINPTSQAVGAGGGTATVQVTASTGCAWSASSGASWLTVTSGANGSGNGAVTLTVAANGGAARSGTATIAGQTLTVNQAAGSTACTYAVDPTGFSVYHLAYQDSFQVVTGAGCAWTAVSEAAWLRITSAASGTGTGRVSFEVSANPAMTERTGVIRVGTVTFTIRQMGALASFVVDAKSNIFAAGRATAFNGLLPPGYRFAAGPGKVLELDAVNGATHCQGGTPTIPADGAAFCVSGSTDVLSYRGIGGIVHGRKVMFLVGVFLDDREPADPAPARLDFTNNEDYTTLSPVIGQVFFLGNGRTAANAQQTVVVPETATRLYLGFADAEAFHGAPGAYQDNTGGLTVGLRVAPGTGGGGSGGGTGLTIDARSNIFASGRATAFDGLLPPSVRLAAGTGRIVTVTNATGTVRCSSGSAPMGPDGGTECSSTGTDITSYQGIAGVIHTRRTMFLVGVFLTDAEPADPAPARLDFSNNDGFATLAPLIGQTFFIGDGMTGTGTGTVQQFIAPDTATRLFLGFADGYALHGSPGYYSDNSGSLGVTVSGGSGGAGCSYAVSPATLTVAAAGGASEVAVTTAAACAWTAVSNAAWIRVTSAGNASGPATVNVSVDANTGSARSGTLTIAGQTVTVNQGAGGGTGCTYAIAPGSASFPAAGGTGRIDITTQSGCAWTATATATWITFTAGQSGTGSGAVSYAVAANANPNNRLGTISVGGKNHPVEQSGTAQASIVSITPGGVVDLASYSPGLAPGSLFSIFGTDLAATTKSADSLPLSTTLEGVTVEVIDGASTIKAPLFFVSPGQVNAQLPYGLKGASVQVRVRNSKGDSAPVTVAIEPRAPRLFPWEGTNAIVVHNDYRLVTAQAPAMPGEALIAFLVGMGEVNPPVAAGAAAPVSPLSKLTDTVTVKLGGADAGVLFAGLAPYYVGLYQVNFQVPSGVAPGRMSLVVTVGSFSAQSDLSIACDANWQSGSSGTIGSAGGRVQAGALTLTVPAGAWATAQTLQVSESASGSEWSIAGVPASTAQALDLTVELKRAPEVGGVAFLLAGSTPGDERVIRATVQGLTVRAKLPVRPGAAAQGREASADQAESFLLFLLTGLETAKSQSGLFEVQYPLLEPATGKYDQAYADMVRDNAQRGSAVLDSGWKDVLPKLGFNDPGLQDSIFPVAADGSREPMMVELVHKKQMRKPPAEPFGEIRRSSWDGSRMMVVDYEEALGDPKDWYIRDRPSLRFGRLFHLFVHRVQQYFDPLPAAGQTSSWLWINEASACLAERVGLGDGKYLPGVYKEQLSTFLAAGLNEPASGSKADYILQYGTGAALFLEDLWRQDGKNDFLHRIYTLRRVSPVPMLPWATLTGLLTKPTERWVPFARRVAMGTLAEGFFPVGFGGNWSAVVDVPLVLSAATILSIGNDAATFSKSDLNSWSAIPVKVQYAGTAPAAGTEISVNLDAGDNAQVDLYFVKADLLRPQISDKLGTAPPKQTVKARSGEDLFLFLIQSKAAAANGKVEAAVTVRRADVQPAQMPWAAPGPTNFNFDSAVPMRSSPTRLDRTMIQVWSSDYDTTIKWAYPSFTLTAPSRSYEDNNPSLTVSGSVDSARKLLEVSIDAKRPNGSTQYSRVRIELKNLPCSYREDGSFYYYTCEVSGDALRSNASAYVSSFTDELWTYKFNGTPSGWTMDSRATPDYAALNPNAAGLQVQLRGRL